MTVTTTLQSRLREAMKDADITPAQLWQRCKGKVTKTAFYKWINGPSKTLKSNHASMLARILRVREKWLSTGIGPKSIDAHEAVDATFYELARAITAAAPFFLRIVELAQQLEREAAQADAPPQKRSLKKRS